jgi:hypothetical protein
MTQLGIKSGFAFNFTKYHLAVNFQPGMCFEAMLRERRHSYLCSVFGTLGGPAESNPQALV